MRRFLVVLLVALVAAGTIAVAWVLGGSERAWQVRLAVFGGWILWCIFSVWFSLWTYDLFAERGRRRRR